MILSNVITYQHHEKRRARRADAATPPAIAPAIVPVFDEPLSLVIVPLPLLALALVTGAAMVYVEVNSVITTDPPDRVDVDS